MKKQNKKQLDLPTLLLIIGGVLILTGLGGFIGLPLVIIGVVLMSQKNKQKKQAKALFETYQAEASPAEEYEDDEDEVCPNPEPHRHFDVDDPCPNPEPHRHFEADNYDTFETPSRNLTDKERRKENLKCLYEAGLLTREEYRDELAKL